MLIVMENRNLHTVAQLALDIEALWRLDVFQINATKGRLKRGDDVAQFVGVVLVDFDVEHINAGKFFEQHALAFHHRLGGQRSDITQAEHCRAIGDDGDQIAARGVAEGIGRVDNNFFTSSRHTRRIGECQIALIGQLLGGCDADFSWGRKLMIFEGGLTQLIAQLLF